jgi:hypothetical protein
MAGVIVAFVAIVPPIVAFMVTVIMHAVSTVVVLGQLVVLLARRVVMRVVVVLQGHAGSFAERPLSRGCSPDALRPSVIERMVGTVETCYRGCPRCGMGAPVSAPV